MKARSNLSSRPNRPSAHTMLMPDVLRCDLSLEEIGVLGQMLNMPECDYITPKQLAQYSSDSPEVVAAILDSLVKKKYLHRIHGVYCVNKFKLAEMQLCKIPPKKVIRFADDADGQEV